MFDHSRKLKLMARIEEASGKDLWMHNDGQVEYFAEKKTGKILYILDPDNYKDEAYTLELIALSHNS